MDIGFFASVPQEPERRPERVAWRPPPWLQPPDDELPAVLVGRRVLARTERVVLWMSTVEVYTTGVRIPVQTVVRRKDEPLREWQARMHFSNPFETDEGALRFGVELADGTKRSTAGARAPDFHEKQPDGAVFIDHGGGGSGGEDRWDGTHNLWLWPLPPAGPIGLVFEWRAEGLSETRIELQADPLVEAVPHVERMWGGG